MASLPLPENTTGAFCVLRRGAPPRHPRLDGSLPQTPSPNGLGATTWLEQFHLGGGGGSGLRIMCRLDCLIRRQATYPGLWGCPTSSTVSTHLLGQEQAMGEEGGSK